jgi:hypothetical protein
VGIVTSILDRHRRRGVGSLPRLEEVVVLALASERLARAISIDEITAPGRARLSRWAEADGESRARSWIVQLVHCPMCVGWWTSVGISLVTPGRHRVLRGAAVAGVQVPLALAERLISEEGRLAIHTANHAEEQTQRSAA